VSTYVFGDIQGCFAELRSLLDQANFDPTTDEAWFVGDLVNRGPDNRATLDLMLELGSSAVAVLGNHDLHFLAIASGCHHEHKNDTLGDLLESPALLDYVEWLRGLPLLHVKDPNVDSAKVTVMVHAGLPPMWDLDTCLARASEVETVLRSDEFPSFLRQMYGNLPAVWEEDLVGVDRLRMIINYFTRMRYCRQGGRELELTHKADIQPPGFLPWFDVEPASDARVLFGHWAALNGVTGHSRAVALDTGCVWGRDLTALRLEDSERFLCRAFGD
jgi:bis(5'-nucleosyl)-tetraphosphatase (symmetrical)